LALSRLKHPYALKVHDRGRTEEGIFWIAMELLEGEPLSSRLAREGPLSEDELIEILGPVCEVLTEAHEKGIVHRDIKPDNIMLTPVPGGGTLAKLIDFGLVSLPDASPLTQSHLVSGTPQYMAPEQWGGLVNADRRSDIYSLGVVAYECLAGRLPL